MWRNMVRTPGDARCVLKKKKKGEEGWVALWGPRELWLAKSGSFLPLFKVITKLLAGRDSLLWRILCWLYLFIVVLQRMSRHLKCKNAKSARFQNDPTLQHEEVGSLWCMGRFVDCCFCLCYKENKNRTRTHKHTQSCSIEYVALWALENHLVYISYCNFSWLYSISEVLDYFQFNSWPAEPSNPNCNWIPKLWRSNILYL